MNPTIEQMLNRRSVRNFSGQAVTQEDLQLILQSAHQAPTSVNGQQISLVVIRDKETIQKVADIAGGQPQVAGADIFVAVVVDYFRAESVMKELGQEIVIPRAAEGIMAGAVDAGIMLNAIQTAAEAMGYGTTAIGGIRRDPQAMIELLGLPKNTYPLVGTTIGVPDTDMPSAVKPRVAIESFAMYEKYDANNVASGAKQYDKDLRQWWDKIGMTDMPSYAASTGSFYSQVYFPTIAKTLKAQGFGFDDTIE
ncbi:nitroreductase family protein [Vibrio sp. F74]|uniref:nitroreductase family protein n=1 Tax=Vibrio sp. F74 TaxID=700020 RepID=UPI0035F57467